MAEHHKIPRIFPTVEARAARSRENARYTLADALTDADAFDAYTQKMRDHLAKQGLSGDALEKRVHYLSRVHELRPELFAIIQRYQVLRRALDRYCETRGTT